MARTCRSNLLVGLCAKMHKIDLGKRPDIESFMARVVARPAMQETLKARGLAK